MASPRDDIVIKLRATRRSEKPVRARAEEEKRTTQTKRRRGGMMRRLRAARKARRRLLGRRGAAARGGRAAKAAAARGAAFKGAMKGAGKAFGVVAIVLEAIILGGQAARRLGGQSERFVEATDAHTLLGDLDEEATATANARNFIESNGNLLRIIAQQGKVNSQILRIASDMKKSALHRAMGADLINREPQFDSADTVIDLLIKKGEDVNLKGLVDKAAYLIRAAGGLNSAGSIKTAR